MMPRKEHFAIFTSTCPGVEAQRQVFSLLEAEPSGSLFLPVRSLGNLNLDPLRPKLDWLIDRKHLVQGMKYHLRGMQG